ncbi:ComF family protein [Halomonas garicola]|uniref:ComF family protein n=1 Tax=Halomonas garicola TaxID=1690008 RepID=UPI002897D30A|nr:ComF family protein [Halomonas garicola]
MRPLIDKKRVANGRAAGNRVAGALATLEKHLRRAMPGHCAFCLGEPAPEQSWCMPCYRELAWNRNGCCLCAEPLSRAQALCRRCRAASPAFARARVPLVYQGAVRELVQDFKFHASPRAGTLLVELFVSALDETPAEALVPVPLHPARARQRGFNQARWLAGQLGTRLGLPVIEASRRVDTPSQRPLSRGERFANLAEAFAVATPLPERVALVDDVMTTGATVNALALAARRAGAREVVVYALARTSLGAS